MFRLKTLTSLGFISCRLRGVQVSLQQQATLLQHIANKLNITEAGYTPPDYGSIPFADQTSLSVYDNLSLLGNKPESDRYRSIRLAGQERPQSVVI